MPKIKVERSILINSPAEVVYPAISDFKKWIEWSPWLLMEPEVKVKIADDSQSYEWEGDRLGSGNMHIKATKENEHIDFDLNFIKPWKSTNTTSMYLQSVDGGTEVKWVMNSNLPFYLFWMSKMMEAFIGSDYERGLVMLKAFVEEGEIHSKLEFLGESTFESCQWVGIKTSCSTDAMANQMQGDFAAIKTYADEMKENVVGPPFTIYSKWDLVKNRVDYTACIPVSEVSLDLPSNFVSGSIPNTKVQKLKHVGAYKHIGNAWATGQAMMRNKEFKPTKKIFPFEIYKNDPSITPESELVTEIHFPLK